MTSLVVASRNAHKVAEMQNILGGAFACVPMSSFAEAPSLVEDGETFAANATRKARQLVEWLRRSTAARGPHAGILTGTDGAWVLADDSGLEVDALGGAPGVQSARFAVDEPGAGYNAPDAANNAKLLRLLKDVSWERRSARFRCVLALIAMDARSPVSEPLEFEGRCEGRIALAPRGQGGFGYDPLFVPAGYELSFAEMGEEVKNRLSHRYRALAELQRWFTASRAAP